MGRQPSVKSKLRWLADNTHKRTQINKNWKLRAVYGITPETYHELLTEQDYRCAICKNEFVTEPRNNARYPHLDHEHSSGWIRGILCSNCNHAIGLLGEDVDRMEVAIRYIIDNSAPTEFSLINAKAACRITKKVCLG
jgi:DNA-directed RNA polymerase subunit RPC12/RpoP